MSGRKEDRHRGADERHMHPGVAPAVPPGIIAYRAISYRVMRDIRSLFPTDVPVPADMMIGRRGDVEEIAGALARGTNIVLVGSRRTGKTSVAEAVLDRLRRSGSYTASIDLFRRRDAMDLAEGIAQAVLANRSAIRRLLNKIRDTAGAAADAATITATARIQAELGDAVELALRPGTGARDAGLALRAALELPQRIAVADKVPVVMFLDEFQDISSPAHPFGDPDRITKQMRAIFQRSPDVSFLFAGSIEHVMRDLFGPADRALSQFGSFRALSTITHDEWRSGLASRLKQANVTADEPALQELVKLGDGHPRSTMLIAREAVAACTEGRLSASEVQVGWEMALTSDRLRHEQTLERIKLTKHALAVATRVARGGHPYTGLPPSAVHRALRALEIAGLADSPARGQWRIDDPLLREYIARLPGR